MVQSYDTLGSTFTIRSSSTTTNVGFANAMAIVGGFDVQNGSANANEVKEVSSGIEAADYFGEGSELANAVTSAIPNPVGTIYAVGVSETETTESFSGSSGGTLSNMPVFAPSLHADEDITVTDTTEGADLTVNEVHGTPSTPTETDTVNINTTTGDWEADASSDYDITYSYGDYESALTEVGGLNVRTIALNTEAYSITSKGVNELQKRARNMDFKRLFVGADPAIDPTEISNYDPETDDWRVVEVAPSRATLPNGNKVRTVNAVAAMAAGQPINVDGSITYDTVAGLDTLATEYIPTEAKQFKRVTALTDAFEIVEGVTTSTESAFSDIYQCEIIDLVTLNISNVVKSYKGGGNLDDDRTDLSADTKTLLKTYSTNRPPALASGDGSKPYSVTISQGASDTAANMTIGIDPAPIMKTVNLSFNVGDVVTFEGATAE